MDKEQLWLALILCAPWAVVLIVAILRGYSVKLWKGNGKRKGGDDVERR